MTDEAWIQRSLARLEALEEQRAQLEAQGNTAELARVDGEMRVLYEALEAAADDSDSGDADDEEDTMLRAAAGAPSPASQDVGGAAHSPFASAPAPSPAAAHSPFATPVPPTSPVSSNFGVDPSPSSDGFSSDDGMSDSMASGIGSGIHDDFDIRTGSRAPMMFGVAAIVTLLGAGGWYAFGRPKAESAPPAQQEVKVITATQVGQDTQEPRAAEGADADRTPGTQIRPTSAARPRSGGGGSAAPTSDQGDYEEEVAPESTKRDGKSRVEVAGDTKDPLGGLK